MNDKDKEKDTSKNVLTHEGENKYIRQRIADQRNQYYNIYIHTKYSIKSNYHTNHKLNEPAI